MRRPILVALLGVLTAVLIGSAAFVVVPRWLAPATVEVPPPARRNAPRRKQRSRSSVMRRARRPSDIAAHASRPPGGALI